MALAALSLIGLASWGLSMQKKIAATIPPNSSPTVAFDVPMTMNIGDTVSFSDGLTLYLKEINDSRCRPNVQCIWAGELAATLVANGGMFITPADTVSISTVTHKTINQQGYIFTLDDATETSATITVSLAANDGGHVACTQEAKQCPDGSYVGRTGPNCEFAQCAATNANGYIAGHVTIGPFCPVERPDQPCPTPTEAYTSRDVVIYASDGVTENKRVPLDTQGNYRIALTSGNYYAQIQPAGIGSGEKKPFTVKPLETTTVDFDIDTGIR